MKPLSIPFAIVIAFSFALNLAAQPNKPWLIGIVEPLTGPLATEGLRRDKVNKMWADDINAKGGINGHRVELVVCNDEARPEKAVGCARDMLEKGVAIIFSNSPAASTRAIQPLVRNGPPLIIPSPNALPAPDTFGFQVSPTAATNTEVLARYLKENGIHKIGMVATTDASGEVEVKSAQDIFGPYQIELKLARIDPKATDGSAQLASVAQSGVPVIYLSYSGGGAVTVVKSYKNLGLQQPLIISYGNISTSFVQLIKDIMPPRLLAVGVVGLVPEALKDSGQQLRMKAFVDAYRMRFNEPLDQLSLNARAELDVAEAIFRHVANPYDFPSVKKFLEATRFETTRTQAFSPTTHVGPGLADVMVVEFKNGRWTRADPLGRQ